MINQKPSLKLITLGTLLASAISTCPSYAEDTTASPLVHVHHYHGTELPFASTGAAVAGPYSPSQIRHAYGIDQLSETGKGQMIAIIEAYGSPTIQHDLNTFSSTFGIANTTINFAYPSGRPTQTNSTWAIETSLDVEWAHAIAPGATILLVVAKTGSFTDLMTAVDFAVKQNVSQISMSWGSPEFSTETTLDSHFNHSNVSFFASAGDSGTGTEWPSASPYVVAVGGTSLSLDATGDVLSETAWDGSGGGISLYETQPSYQRSWRQSSYRNVPDVSYSADPNYGFYVYDSTSYDGNSGWWGVGGTSAGAPQWAALFALANQKRLIALKGGANAALYSLGSPTSISNYFRDIVSGCNSQTSSATTCAEQGYDDVTGLGSPLANLLVPSLIGF